MFIAWAEALPQYMAVLAALTRVLVDPGTIRLLRDDLLRDILVISPPVP